MAADGKGDLCARLSEVLEVGSEYVFHHLSCPPTKSDALFAAPPGQRPQRTSCESHFLLVSIITDKGAIFVFAIEVLVYSTESLTTLFVSKADSTGYLALRPTLTRPSPIRPITSTFISWLVEHRRRPGVPLVVSLFARAQDQYLFPGSVDHGGKHVLDDRMLVKWWCKTLDPILRKIEEDNRISKRAHVIVPGFDQHETASFFPLSHRADPSDSRKWQHGYPVQDVAPNPSAPPRCLVPHFPDDPKARYLDELDDEIPDARTSQTLFSTSKKGNGMWKSIRTLEQFWDTMAFRQECSSGRLVGFIWLVFTPVHRAAHLEAEEITSMPTPSLAAGLPSSSQLSTESIDTTKSGLTRRTRKRKKLTGPIVPRQPKIKSSTSDISERGGRLAYGFWPETARGQVVLDYQSYTRVHDLLLRLDFANADAAAGSTRKWIQEATTIAASPADWGKLVRGVRLKPENKDITGATQTNPSQINDLSASIVRKKRRNTSDQPEPEPSGPADVPAVNVLSSSMVRKKPKVNRVGNT